MREIFLCFLGPRHFLISELSAQGIVEAISGRFDGLSFARHGP